VVAGDVEFGGGQGLEVGLHEALAPADHVDVLGAENRRRSLLEDGPTVWRHNIQYNDTASKTLWLTENK
jgi:hypothetical protein